MTTKKRFLVLLTYSDGDQYRNIFDTVEEAHDYIKKSSEDVCAGDPWVSDYSILKVKEVE